MTGKRALYKEIIKTFGKISYRIDSVCSKDVCDNCCKCLLVAQRLCNEELDKKRKDNLFFKVVKQSA